MKKILVIDDDRDILDALALVLEDAGYQVEISENGEYLDGLADPERKTPDLVILDILLSGLDGRDIVRNMRRNKGLQKVPVIMISAHPTGEKTSIAAGADEFLEKPFDIDELLSTVKRFV